MTRPLTLNTGLLISMLFTILFTSGCSNAKKELHKKVFKGSPTMKSIIQNRHQGTSPKQPDYRQAPDWPVNSGSSGNNAYRPAVYIPAGETNHEAYSRNAKKELNGLFPRLPNPDLCMYVYPHLSSENATVPGYTSCFAMYDTNQFALPGEMNAIWQQRPESSQRSGKQ